VGSQIAEVKQKIKDDKQRQEDARRAVRHEISLCVAWKSRRSIIKEMLAKGFSHRDIGRFCDVAEWRIKDIIKTMDVLEEKHDRK